MELVVIKHDQNGSSHSQRNQLKRGVSRGCFNKSKFFNQTIKNLIWFSFPRNLNRKAMWIQNPFTRNTGILLFASGFLTYWALSRTISFLISCKMYHQKIYPRLLVSVVSSINFFRSLFLRKFIIILLYYLIWYFSR